MRRRDFLKNTALATVGACSALTRESAVGTETMARRAGIAGGIIDTNVSLSRWPFRRLPLDETATLVAKLKASGVVQAWAASFDALLHKDIAAANQHLAEECRKHGRETLLPFGTVNPRLPAWEDDFRRCHEIHKMRGIRLFPNYHGYKLGDPELSKLLAAAESQGLVVQVAVSMEDERVQHPLMQVANVDMAPLPESLRGFPRLRIVLLNWFRSVKGDLLAQLAKTSQIWFDISMVEGVGGIANLFQEVSAEQVVFGSHAPFFYLESSVLKLRESALAADESRMIAFENARRILSKQSTGRY